MTTQVVGGVRTLTANHDLTVVNAGATGFSKNPVAFVLLVETQPKKGFALGALPLLRSALIEHTQSFNSIFEMLIQEFNEGRDANLYSLQ